MKSAGKWQVTSHSPPSRRVTTLPQKPFFPPSGVLWPPTIQIRSPQKSHLPSVNARQATAGPAQRVALRVIHINHHLIELLQVMIKLPTDDVNHAIQFGDRMLISRNRQRSSLSPQGMAVPSHSFRSNTK